MTPEEFLRNEIRRSFGEAAARDFEFAFLMGLTCELCEAWGARLRLIRGSPVALCDECYEAKS